MTFDFHQILASKRAFRHALAARDIVEKLAMLKELRTRTLMLCAARQTVRDEKRRVGGPGLHPVGPVLSPGGGVVVPSVGPVPSPDGGVVVPSVGPVPSPGVPNPSRSNSLRSRDLPP